ncbi:MAG: sulfatase-like hydrolase/transferase [Bacteroidetes bacterium]|nr:sulfatase-like hydrolase/transferase [Bacteroidota bacterium]
MNTILKSLVFLGQLIALVIPFANCAAQTQPNVILIVADDLGWNDVGYHGSEIQTPTIDRLTREGVELNRFYAHPTCSPSRSALITGKAPLRLEFLTPLVKNNALRLPLTETTMADYFQKNGYQTSLIGKWHLGRFSKAYWPTNRGFDHFYGFLTGGIGHYDHFQGGGLDWQRNGKTVREEKGHSNHRNSQS